MKRIITTLSIMTVLSSQQLAWPIFLSISLQATFTSEVVARPRGGRRGGASRTYGGQSRNRVNRQPTSRNNMNRDRTNSGRVNRDRTRPNDGTRPRQSSRDGDRTFNRDRDRTNAVNRGDVNINRNNINFNGRNYRRPNNVNINVRRNVYVGRPGWRTYGRYWGPYGVHAGFAWLSFLTAALLIGSYSSAQNNQTVYVYIVEEDGVEKEYQVDENGKILSEQIVS